MATPKLGRLEPVPLNEVWPNEASDFTPWLADPKNLTILADALGMSLEFEAREKAVGPFSADVVCRNPDDDTCVVVENQLGSTDHDHLGKLLTYAAHLDAQVVVWIAKSFREQHRAAVDWLNHVSGQETRFFGLEIVLWRIGDSVTAPQFNVVASPNDWRGTKGDEELPPIKRVQLEFWKGFEEFVGRNGQRVTKTHDPRPQGWLGITGVGKTGFFLVAVMSTWTEARGHELRAEFQITGGDSDYYFDLHHEQRQEIDEAIRDEHDFNDELDWHNPPGVNKRRIFWRLATDFRDPDRRTDQHRWLLDRIEALHRIFAPRVQKLPAPD